MIKIIEAEIAAREFRGTAYHEAGHLVLAQKFGALCEAFVWKNEAECVANGEKAWRGQTVMMVSPTDINYDEATRLIMGIIRPIPNNWRVLYGLAGVVSESMARGVADLDEVIANILCEDLSETDTAAMGENWSSEDVQRTMELLSGAWEEVERVAIALMELPRPPKQYG